MSMNRFNIHVGMERHSLCLVVLNRQLELHDGNVVQVRGIVGLANIVPMERPVELAKTPEYLVANKYVVALLEVLVEEDSFVVDAHVLPEQLLAERLR